jgi:hypothetical protein
VLPYRRSKARQLLHADGAAIQRQKKTHNFRRSELAAQKLVHQRDRFLAR